MSWETKCLAVIPARGGSKGLPRKNILPFNGKPLIVYSIEAALKSRWVTETMVTTDSEDIAEIAKAAGAQVPFLRPAELADDQAASIDVLMHAVDFYERELGRLFDTILLLQPTSPLRIAEDIDLAYEAFARSTAESLQSVTKAATHPYLLRKVEQNRLIPYLDEKDHLRRQDLQQLYELNGAIYLMKRDLLMNKGKIVGENNAAYVMPRERSIDIDDELDFCMAEYLCRQRRG